MMRQDNRFPPIAAATAALSIAAVLFVACATNPATGRRQLALMSVEQEIAMGREAHQEILQSMGAYDDPELQAYVDRIGQRLAQASERPDLPWTFTVIDDPSVNAFALPGGFIYLTRGILGYMRSEAEMASVLGHEIGHVTARHSVERISKAQLANIGLVAGMILSPEMRSYGDLAQTGLGVLFLKFSRDDERQADDLGFRYLNQAGYEPREMVEMFRVLDRVSEGSGAGRLPDWLATHPSPTNRIDRLQQAIAAAPAEVLGDRIERDPFLARIDGVVFGSDPREGYFLGQIFYHPELAFTFRFPEEWKLQNRKEAVVGVSPREDAIVALTLEDADSPGEAARRFFRQRGVAQGRSWRSSIGGMPAASNSFQVDRQQGGDLAGLVAFVEKDGRVYRLLGFTEERRLSTYDELLAESLGSFEELRDRRFLDVEPKRIEVVRIPVAMTLEELGQTYPSTVELDTLAIVNHLERGERLEAGQAYKRVVGGEIPGHDGG